MKGFGVRVVVAAALAMGPSVAARGGAAADDAALDRLVAAAERDPADAAAADALAAFARSALEGGDPGRARLAASRLAALRPDDAARARLLARICLALGDLDGAERVLRDALRARPGERATLDLLLDALEAGGRHRDMAAAWEEHLRHHPGSAAALDARARIFLWNLHDVAGAGTAIDRMESVAAHPETAAATADWLRRRAAALRAEVDGVRRRRDAVVGARGALNRRLALALAAAAVLFAAAMYALRPPADASPPPRT